MARFSNNLIIGRPINEVFRFVADFENMPKWNYYVVEVNKVTTSPIGVGTVFRQVRKTDTQRYKIVEFEPNRKVVVETLPPAPALQMRFTFEPAGGGTRLTDEWELKGGLIGLFGSFAAGRVKAAVAENLAKLKQLLETGEVRLQDGRVERI
ncbi:MAG TPA: SRPBCC family protein [Anaerolineae bacterium]|nr:SRPBCC family protein [Anaerolineae bacterium]